MEGLEIGVLRVLGIEGLGDCTPGLNKQTAQVCSTDIVFYTNLSFLPRYAFPKI